MPCCLIRPRTSIPPELYAPHHYMGRRRDPDHAPRPPMHPNQLVEVQIHEPGYSEDGERGSFQSEKNREG